LGGREIKRDLEGVKQYFEEDRARGVEIFLRRVNIKVVGNLWSRSLEVL
jgi:hypothetical protein